MGMFDLAYSGLDQPLGRLHASRGAPHILHDPCVAMTTYRTSQLKFLREGFRLESFERARRDLEAGKLYPVRIELWPDLKQPVLGDGRHRLLMACALGWSNYPATIVTYGPRGGVKSKREWTVDLDEAIDLQRLYDSSV